MAGRVRKAGRRSVIQPGLFPSYGKIVVSHAKRSFIERMVSTMIGRKMVYSTHSSGRGRHPKRINVRRRVEQQLERLAESGFVDLKRLFTRLERVQREGRISHDVEVITMQIASSPGIVKRFAGFEEALPKITESIREIVYWMGAAERSTYLRKAFKQRG